MQHIFYKYIKYKYQIFYFYNKKCYLSTICSIELTIKFIILFHIYNYPPIFLRESKYLHYEMNTLNSYNKILNRNKNKFNL